MNYLTIISCSDCWMALGMANERTWLQFYSARFYLMVYQISKVCTEFLYIQHRHMVYGNFHRRHYLVLDQNASDNAYLSPLHHEVWNMDLKMVMLEIDKCCNTFSHLCVQRQHYLEHNTVCMSIFFHWIFFCICPDQWHHFCECYSVRCCLNPLTKLTSFFWLPVYIFIWESNLFDPWSWTLDINWYI